LSVFLITGANRGIGLELSKQICHRGDKVIATCRKTSIELDALGVEVIENIDISSFKSISILKNNLNNIKLDGLFHNAGILENNSFDSLDAESIKRQFEVNALSPLLITIEILPYLNNYSKIAFITSRMGSISDNTSGGSYGYRMSKVALSMAARSLSIDLLKRNIYVAIIHPGLVRTRMTGFTKNGISTEHSVKGILERLDQLDKNNTGTFWHSNGEILPW
tara:strand:+ start:12102 stop:12767 length:666 start_codon:yes stop_codon:yes gene_type:complete